MRWPATRTWCLFLTLLFAARRLEEVLAAERDSFQHSCAQYQVRPLCSVTRLQPIVERCA